MLRRRCKFTIKLQNRYLNIEEYDSSQGFKVLIVIVLIFLDITWWLVSTVSSTPSIRLFLVYLTFKHINALFKPLQVLSVDIFKVCRIHAVSLTFGGYVKHFPILLSVSILSPVKTGTMSRHRPCSPRGKWGPPLSTVPRLVLNNNN